MARKAKKRLHPMPKLGAADQCLYWFSMLLTGGGCIAAIIVPILLRSEIAFADDRVVAFTEGRGVGNYLYLFAWLFIVLLAIAGGPYQQRRPIFGRRGVKYGPPAYPRIYPLLMKDKPKFWVSPKVQANQKKLRLFLTALALVTLLFSLAMFPRSLYGREVLYRDGTVAVYSPGDREEAHYKFSEITSVELDTYYRTRRRSFSGSWNVRMTIHLADGDTFYFSSGDFSGDWTTTLETMLALKERYGSLVAIAGTEHLSDVVYSRELNAAEKALLYQLFDAG